MSPTGTCAVFWPVSAHRTVSFTLFQFQNNNWSCEWSEEKGIHEKAQKNHRFLSLFSHFFSCPFPCFNIIHWKRAHSAYFFVSLAPIFRFVLSLSILIKGFLLIWDRVVLLALLAADFSHMNAELKSSYSI